MYMYIYTYTYKQRKGGALIAQSRWQHITNTSRVNPSISSSSRGGARTVVAEGPSEGGRAVCIYYVRVAYRVNP